MTMQVIEPLSVAEIQAARLRTLRADLPAWDGDETDPVYKAGVENYALREFARRELENAHALSLDPRAAVDGDLDAIGLRVLLPRMSGEANETYRARILSGQGLSGIESACSLPFYRVETAKADARIESVGIEFDATAKTISAYLLTNEAANGEPSASVRSAAAAYMRERIAIDYTLSAPAPTITPYTITATLDIDPASGLVQSDVEESARTAIYAYVRARRAFRTAIRRSAIIAALSVDGIESVSVTAPAADLTIAPGDEHTAYYCPADAVSVVLTFQSV